MKTPTPSEVPHDDIEFKDWKPDEPAEEPTPERPALDFTPDECDAIQIYIDDVKKFLGLEKWDVYLTTTSSTPDANASIHPVMGRYVAALSVNKDWWSYDPHMQRNTIVHELLHITHHFATETVRFSNINKNMMNLFARDIELMVDHLAGVVDHHVPLPYTPKQVAKWRKKKTGPFAE